MNKIFNLLFLLFFCTMNAQIHEIGVFLGGSNYIGDVGKTTYIAPNEGAFGVLYKYNRSPRHSFRFSAIQSKLSDNDLDSKESSRNQRGYKFNYNVKEVSLGLEFNFFDFNLHTAKTQFTPYVYSGINYFRYNESSVVSENIQPIKRKNAFAIPMTLGIKTNFSPHFIIAMEVGARYTFTDNLDGSNPTDDNLFKFGNLNNNDWYVFSGVTLTYTFGNKPCYCAQ